MWKKWECLNQNPKKTRKTPRGTHALPNGLDLYYGYLKTAFPVSANVTLNARLASLQGW